MKKILCIIITFFFVMPSVFASTCKENPEYDKWLKLSDEEKKNTPEPVPYLCYLDVNETKKLSSSNSTKIVETDAGLKTVSASDSKYDSRDYGLISPVKRQNGYSNCWAHTGNALYETAAILSGFDTLDFSEKHVVVNTFYDIFKDRHNVGGYNADPEHGGNVFMYASYAFRHLGPYLETEYPYITNNPTVEYANLYSSSLPTKKPMYDLESIVYVATNDGCTSNKKALIKNALLAYGAVGSSINAGTVMDTYYVNKNDTIADHEITIIGWDDTIPASKFGNGVTTNGGWLIKNSWGPNSGDNGIFYISYEDSLICNETYFFEGVDLNNYDNAYATTEQSMSLLEYLAVNTDKYYQSIKMSTKDSNVKEYLGKVSLFLVPGEKVDVYYDKNSKSGKEEFLGSITSYAYGYTSIEFDDIEVKGDYYINITHTYPTTSRYSNFYALSCANDNPDSFAYTLSDYTGGKYYYSYDGTNFIDTSEMSFNYDGHNYDNCRPIVYAYTKKKSNSVMDVFVSAIDTENGYDVYTGTGDYFDITIDPENITDYSLFTVNVYDEELENNLSNIFNIDLSHITNNHIYIASTTAPAGEYKVVIHYGNIHCTAVIRIESHMTSSTFSIKGNYIYITPVKGTDYTVSYLESNMTFNTSQTRLYLSKTNSGLGTNDKVTTGSKLRIGNAYYTIIILGDVNGDGLIRANDYVRIKNHIMEYSIITDDAEKQAADCNQDGRIRANDYVRIKNYIMGS